MSTVMPGPRPQPITDVSPTNSQSDGSVDAGSQWAQFDGLDSTVWSSLNQLSRALRVPEASLHDTLVAILQGALDLLQGAAHGAGVNLLVKGQFRPQAVLGEAPPLLDELQRRTGTGPCIEASERQCRIEITDTNTESRWPEFTSRAVAMGVKSMLCVPLWVQDHRLGSLSLYGSRPHALGGTAINLADLYATHAALALGDAQRTESLRRALSNRDTIGQAKGILMHSRKLSAQDAFELLVAASQRLNRKLVEVAQEVADTGALPAGLG
ncbi:GAF and ANTAR domain-containing protein [Mycobacterium yunnanensis]|uniref:GAF and ANTAR domain-containing protein n=1 Tax=Mycobacterium yunnanensis TaxID=368477 RepID=A0A9X2YZC9_9MYCO|nr:GAF and ANTAR domain-containing protein [Mycobacterium yunnanensis]MCV7420301.1 GAF and ANTAR domain-containing protein [Mycobacterium yunnanensis]